MRAAGALWLALQRAHEIILQFTSGGSERLNSTVTQPRTDNTETRKPDFRCLSFRSTSRTQWDSCYKKPIHGGTCMSYQHWLKQEDHLANQANVSDRK